MMLPIGLAKEKIVGSKMPSKLIKERTSEPPRPLAAALRPKTAADIVGQRHLLGPDKPIRKMIESRQLKSTIFWGPAGTGKTTLANCMATDTESDFYPLDATSAGVKELRTLVDGAFHAWEKHNRVTVVFIDEIHRWSKSQQDVLLPAVENGVIKLLGATTEKPAFAVNSTLLSRLMVFELKPLTQKDLVAVIGRVKAYYKTNSREVAFDSNETIKLLLARCSGDARKLTTVLEMLVEVICEGQPISSEMVDAVIPTKHIYFDASGNEHFDLAHAMQQSLQNSDADAAVFWLAKWIASGEDPVYICRRIMISAFEDAGDSVMAITSAVAAAHAVERTGLPECMIPMAHAVIAIAQAGRAKIAYHAIKAAMDDVMHGETVHIPPDLRAGTTGYVSPITKKYVKGKITQLEDNGQTTD